MTADVAIADVCLDRCPLETLYDRRTRDLSAPLGEERYDRLVVVTCKAHGVKQVAFVARHRRGRIETFAKRPA